MVAAALLTGCTMCPDPYDYSGPVPNGSSPQNNFRARSNGIHPIGAAPVPWPPIVKASGTDGRDGPLLAGHQRSQEGRHAAPTLADPAVSTAAGDDAEAQSEPTSVLVTAAAEEATAEPLATEPDHVIPVFGESGEETPAGEDAAVGERSEAPSAALSQAVSPAPVELRVEMPALAETPGWRPRQAR
jgi:hypothetical protein